MRISKIVGVSVLSVGLIAGLSACGETAPSDVAVAATSSAEPTPSTAVQGTAVADEQSSVMLIDVRTPEEFQAGHLEGAVNIPVEFPELFQAGLATLDKEATYDVYCRSGRRSAIAIAEMKNLGFTSLNDLGGYQEASTATGLPTVS